MKDGDDEAKVREIRNSWMPTGNRLAVDWPGRLNEAVREAYAAGRALGFKEGARSEYELHKRRGSEG